MVLYRLISLIIYIVAILVATVGSVNIGAELITQYTMYSNGYDDIERYLLADDMGFGILLMFGLVVEVPVGIAIGWFVGKYLNKEIKNHINRN